MKDGVRTEEVLEHVAGGPVRLIFSHASAPCQVAPDLHQQTERGIVSSDPSRTKSQALRGQHLLDLGGPRTAILSYTHGLHGASTTAEISTDSSQAALDRSLHASCPHTFSRALPWFVSHRKSLQDQALHYFLGSAGLSKEVAGRRQSLFEKDVSLP